MGVGGVAKKHTDRQKRQPDPDGPAFPDAGGPADGGEAKTRAKTKGKGSKKAGDTATDRPGTDDAPAKKPKGKDKDKGKAKRKTKAEAGAEDGTKADAGAEKTKAKPEGKAKAKAKAKGEAKAKARAEVTDRPEAEHRGTAPEADGGERRERPGAGDGPELRQLLRVPAGERVDLRRFDARATPAGPADKAAGIAATAAMAERLGSLQERLYAAATAGSRRRVLLVLQGMDTSGKGGTVKHVIGAFNPSGCRIRAFKAPTPEEHSHPFLWRVTQALPQPGEIGIFDRSHYEDVLIARVRELVPRSVIGRRYGQINRFEQSLAEDGVSVVKVFLHISYEEQRERLLARLDDPDKHWKFSRGDIDDRALWPAYQEAYEKALERCSTDAAPWFVVPADRKWYRNWAISTLLLEHLEAIGPQYPKGDFDVEECRARLIAT